MGPVASQEAIKMLGTNGGGFFNANSAHPYENPTPLSNFLQMLAIFLIPAALCFTFGRMVGDPARAGRAGGDDVMFVVLAIAAMHFEQQGNPLLARWASTRRQRLQAGGNMEGKEVRFGIAASACSPPSPRPPPAARSTPCTTRSRRWAAWCRWC
jgi:K+-transporting ATPase ATPase A chain